MNEVNNFLRNFEALVKMKRRKNAKLEIIKCVSAVVMPLIFIVYLFTNRN